MWFTKVNSTIYNKAMLGTSNRFAIRCPRFYRYPKEMTRIASILIALLLVRQTKGAFAVSGTHAAWLMALLLTGCGTGIEQLRAPGLYDVSAFGDDDISRVHA